MSWGLYKQVKSKVESMVKNSSPIEESAKQQLLSEIESLKEWSKTYNLETKINSLSDTVRNHNKKISRILSSQYNEALQEKMNFTDEEIALMNMEYKRLYSQYEKEVETFKKSKEFSESKAIVRVYIKTEDFFDMNGLKLDRDDPLPPNWENYSYIEGIMTGGSKECYEMKLNLIKTFMTKSK